MLAICYCVTICYCDRTIYWLTTIYTFHEWKWKLKLALELTTCAPLRRFAIVALTSCLSPLRDSDLWRSACLRVWGRTTLAPFKSWREMFLERPRVCFDGNGPNILIVKRIAILIGKPNPPCLSYAQLQLVINWRVVQLGITSRKFRYHFRALNEINNSMRFNLQLESIFTSYPTFKKMCAFKLRFGPGSIQSTILPTSHGSRHAFHLK